MADDELVVVFDAASEVDALLYRSLLEEAGIDVVERQLEPDLFLGVRQRGLYAQLLVRAEDAERAAALVDAFRREAATGELRADLADNGGADGRNPDAD